MMSRTTKFVLSAGLFFGLMGCSLSSPESNLKNPVPTSSETQIIGGQKAQTNQDTGYWSVGRLDLKLSLTYSVLGTTANETHLQTCSGVLIGEDLLLTAAHCVIDSNMLGVLPDGKASIAGSVYFPQTQTSIRIKKALFHKAFANVESFDENGEIESTSENDLAILLLDSSIRSPLRPAALLQTPVTDRDRITTRIYGFGVTDSEQLASENRNLDLNFVDTRGLYMADVKKIHHDQSDGEGVCYGDSGGPQFLINENSSSVFLVGISATLREKNSSSHDPCHKRSEAMALPEFRSWIDKASKAVRHLRPDSAVQAF